MPIIGVDHVQLAMPAGEEERARCFYRDLLGLPEQPKPPNLAKRGGWFGTRTVRIHLGVDP
jgi:catechol 2,3-dioxygenase-like lactoylglutathione lyase family enzyme